MRKFYFIILIFLTFLYNLSSETVLDRLLALDESEKALIARDYAETDYLELFKSYAYVSEELDSYQSSLHWFKALEKRIDQALVNDFSTNKPVNLTPEKQELFAEKLLTYLHEEGFKKYLPNANRLSEVINKGEYNCVSSSILYAVFLRKYGIEFQGIETHDHVFIETDFEHKKVDVETTNKFGFNPGQKRDVLNDFGKVTGFTYVPAKDYKNRNSINYKKLLMLVYHNLATLYYQKGNSERSIKLGYMIKQGRSDEKGDEDFSAFFKNYLVMLNRKGKSREAVELINSYFDRFGMDEYLSFRRFGLMHDYVVALKDYNKVDEYREFLLSENSRYPTLKDHKSFQDLYFIFTNKIITRHSQSREFKRAIDEAAAFSKLYSHKDLYKIYNNILNSALNYYDYKKKSFHLTGELLDYAHQNLPDFYETTEKYRKSNVLNIISYEINQKNNERAMELTKSYLLQYKNDPKLLALLKSIYVNYSIGYYKKGDLEKTIFYSEEGLKQFPGDRTLTNNYRTFFQNFLAAELESKNYSQARKILNLALEKFPKDSYFIKLNNSLISINY